METIAVGSDPNEVPVHGRVKVRMSLRLTEFPPMLEPVPDWEFGHRYIEFDTVSPTIGQLEMLIKWVNRKYYKGTTHTFFETIEISEIDGIPLLDLGVGS